MFFFVTLYMQEVLHYAPLRAGAAYLPITAGIAAGGSIASQLVTRIGSRPVVVAGSLIAAAGTWYLSRLPLHGSYVTDLLPGFLIMSLGTGLAFVSITAAANAGVPGDKAGLAAGLLNASQQVGSALGLAILSVLAITRTTGLIAAGAAPVVALDAGYHRALLAGSIFMAAAALTALRISNTRAAAPAALAGTEAPPQPAPSQTRPSRTPVRQEARDGAQRDGAHRRVRHHRSAARQPQ